MFDTSTVFLSEKDPLFMKRNALIYGGCLILLLLCGKLIYDYFSSARFLALILMLFFGWRMFRAVRLRVWGLNKHIWKLSFQPEEKKLELETHTRYFGSNSHQFEFDELTCVIHKSDKPRLVFQLPGLIHTQKEKGWSSVSFRMIILFLSVFFNNLGTSSLFSSLFWGSKDYNLNLRPTALSMVQGRNLNSLIMLPTYGWDPDTLREIVLRCQTLGIRILDKRPHYEKTHDVFL